jgi:hypothetical protein
MHYNVGDEDATAMRCYNVVLVQRAVDQEDVKDML